LLPSVKYELATIPVDPCDLIICFSDGISEAENADGEFWEERRAAELACGCKGMEVIERLIEGCDSFAQGHEQSDDITVTAVRITG